MSSTLEAFAFMGMNYSKNFTFHQQYREQSLDETDVRHIWKVDSRTIRWDVWSVSWFAEITVARCNSMVSLLPLKCIDFFPPPLLCNSPLSKPLEARYIGWPDRVKFGIISSAIRSHDPSGLSVWVPNHSSSVPGAKKDRERICEHDPQLSAYCIHAALCFHLHSKQFHCELT